MRLPILAAVAVLLAASAGQAQSVITRPDWESKPDGASMGRLYPREAASLHVSGRVVMDCDVAADGLLQTCRVVSEDPVDYGFGEAGLRATRLFKMRPQTLDGVPVAGGHVRIPLNFATAGVSRGRPVGFEGPPAILRPAGSQDAIAGSDGPKPRRLPPVPCPGERGRLCTPELFAWATTAAPAQRVDLYGSVELTCRVGADGALERCSGRELMTGARVSPALEAAKRYTAPASTIAGPTAGLWVQFTLRGGRGLQTF